jgi:hypothetical protein
VLTVKRGQQRRCTDLTSGHHKKRTDGIACVDLKHNSKTRHTNLELGTIIVLTAVARGNLSPSQQMQYNSQEKMAFREKCSLQKNRKLKRDEKRLFRCQLYLTISGC